MHVRGFFVSMVLLATAGAGSAVAEGPAKSWPSVSEQVAAAAAPAGSALERLIREHQQLELLAAGELDDGSSLPPWLRVYWRRSHPELAAEPRGGAAAYPLVLKGIYQWMVHHPDLEAVPFEEPLSLSARATGGANVKVNLGPDGRSESDIRINPLSPGQVIAASNNFAASGRLAAYYSSDGGATWGESLLPFTGTDFVHSDPTVDWTSDGRAWSATIGVAPQSRLRVRAYVSNDGGATWSFDATPSGNQTVADKPQMWVDKSASSAFRNTIYVCWRGGSTAYVNRRTGTGWGTATKLSGKETKTASTGCHVTTNSGGDAFVFWPSTGSNQIFLARSSNGGSSWTAPQLVATTFDSFNIGIPAMAGRRVLLYVASDTYENGATDNVYAVWTDLSGEPGCTTAASEPGTNVSSTCKTRIWFARSTNGGVSWQAPVKLHAQASLNDQFNPWLSVDPTSGKIGVMYYDTVADPGRTKAHVYYQSSADQGATWTAPLQVSTASTDETTAGANAIDQFGDYNGMSGFLARFLPIWTDRRSNGNEEIWTAPVSDP